MNSRTVEIWVGVFVALGIAALFMLAMQVSNLGTLGNGNGYILTAAFENVGTSMLAYRPSASLTIL